MLALSDNALGQIYALATAFIWAFALVLFKVSGERITPLALNLYKNTVGLALMFGTLAVMGLGGYAVAADLARQSGGAVLLLLLSGVLGIAVADTAFFRALNLIGVGLFAVIDCCYSPLAIFFAWCLLGEQLSVLQYAGAALVISGVFIATRHPVPHNRTRGQILWGMCLGVFSVGLMAFAIVMVKPALETFPLMWATTLRLLGGTASLALFALVDRGRKLHFSVFRPGLGWRTALPATVLGTYICLILWVAGFKYTQASIAAVLNQTSVVFASILAVFVLKERFSVRKVAALALGFAGVIVVTFADRLMAGIGSVLAIVPR